MGDKSWTYRKSYSVEIGRGNEVDKRDDKRKL